MSTHLVIASKCQNLASFGYDQRKSIKKSFPILNMQLYAQTELLSMDEPTLKKYFK